MKSDNTNIMFIYKGGPVEAGVVGRVTSLLLQTVSLYYLHKLNLCPSFYSRFTEKKASEVRALQGDGLTTVGLTKSEVEDWT